MKQNIALVLAALTLLSTSALADTKKYDVEIAKLQKQITALKQEVAGDKQAKAPVDLSQITNPFNSELLKVSMKMDIEASKHYGDKTGRGFGSAIQAAQLTLKGKLSPEWGYKMRVDFAAEELSTSKGASLYDNGNTVKGIIAILTQQKANQPTEYLMSVNDTGMGLTSDGEGISLENLELSTVKRGTQIKDARLEFYGFYPFILAAGRFMPDLNPDHDDQFLDMPAFSAIVPFEKNQIYALYTKNGLYLSSSLAFSNITSTTSKKDTSRIWYARAAYTPYYNDQDLIHVGVSSALAKTQPKGSVYFNQRPENSLGSVLVGTGGVSDATGSNTYLADISLRKGAFSLQSAYGTTKLKRTAGIASSKFYGCYAQISYSLTGEVRGFDPEFPGFANIKASKPFDLRNGHFGAFEAKYRYSYLNFGKTVYSTFGGVPISTGFGSIINDITGVPANGTTYALNGGKMMLNTVGVNWYPNSNLTFMLDYSLVSVKNSQIWGAIYKMKDGQANGMPAANHKPKIITLRASVKI